MVDLLRWRAANQQNKVAFVFLSDGERQEQAITYGQLDRKAKAIAVRLWDSGCQPGDRALILFPPGLDYVTAFFGCLYAGAIAVPAYPPDPQRLHKTLPRLQAIVDDSDAGFVLSTLRIAASLKAFSLADDWSNIPIIGQAMRRVRAGGKVPPVRLNGARFITTATISSRLANRWTSPRIGKDTLAFLQYTSGSTAKPKGVMVSHSNLLQNEEMIRRSTGSHDGTVSLGWVPLYHDMGLIGSVLHPLYCGVPGYLMSPLAFLQKPARWLWAVSRHGVTFSGGPNFAFDMCVKKVTEAEAEGLDLSRWDIAYSSSEPVRASTLDAFCARFAKHGFRRSSFYPCYGMADATLLVTGCVPDREPITVAVSARELERDRAVPAGPGEEAQVLVGSGRACSRTDLAVVRRGTNAAASPGEIGEIWVAGPHVAQGYWGRTRATEEAYGGTLENNDGHSYLKTGDLGFLQDGELFVTGRIKDVIIIRGRNLYAHDIEAAVCAERERRPEIRPGCCATFGVTDRDAEAVVIFQELDLAKHPGVDPKETALTIRRVVLESFGVAVHSVVLLDRGSIAKTSSGKLMRYACREAFLSDFDGWTKRPLLVDGGGRAATTPAPPVSVAEGPGLDVRAWVLGRLETILGVPSGNVDTTATIVDLGLDSLTLTELAESIRQELEVRLTFDELIHDGSSLDELIETLAHKAAGSSKAVRRAARDSATRIAPSAASSEAEEEESAAPTPASVPAPTPRETETRPPRPKADFAARKRARVHDVPPADAGQSSFHRFVNPFLASLLEDIGLDKHFVRGDGCWLFDDAGLMYLDGISQYGALPFGYNPASIWEAIEAVRRTGEPSFVQPSILDAAGQLAERLLRHAPGMAHVTFANSGAEAVEAAIKLCRSSTGRKGIVAARGGFHGKTLGALSATGQTKYQTAFGAPTEGFTFVPFGDVEALEEALAPGDVAAVILEPIQGEGGVVFPPPRYLHKVSEICRRHGTLLIVDEVQTGLGRTGVMFASIAEGVQPDVLVVAKALGGGLMPIGACLCRAEVYNRDFALKHSSTFAGNALACRAGIAVMDRLEEDGGALLRQVTANGEYLASELARLQSAYPHLVKEVRGQGHMFGIHLAVDRSTWPESIIGCLADQGLLGLLLCSMLLHQEHVRLAPALNGSDVIRVQPPLIAGQAECRQLVFALERTLARISEGNSAAVLQHLLGPPAEATGVRHISVAPAVAEQPGSSRRFAFLVHPLDTASLADLDPRLAVYDHHQLRSLLGRVSRQAEPFVVGEMPFESVTGARCHGTFVSLPHSADQLARMDPKVALEWVEFALETALEASPEVIGLGGYSSVVTQGGLLLPERSLPPLTSGSAMTAIAGEVAIERAMSRRGLRCHETTASIIGAGGVVGSSTALLMTAHARQLILAGNRESGQDGLVRLRRLMLSVVGTLGRGGAPSNGHGSLRQHILERLQTATPETVVDELLASGELVLTNDVGAATKADVIVTATSSAGRILDTQSVDHPAIICELSRPFNASEALASRRGIEYIEGGLVQLPGAPYLGFNAGLPRGQVFACIAETMLLALEGRFDLPLRGHHISLPVLEEIRKYHRKHAFEIAYH